jgi:hypothetical protein
VFQGAESLASVIVRTAWSTEYDHCKGWKVIYEIWSLKSNTLICDTTFEIPPDMMAQPLGSMAHQTNFYGLEFEFPASINLSLRTAIVLHTFILKVVSPPADADTDYAPSEFSGSFIRMQRLRASSNIVDQSGLGNPNDVACNTAHSSDYFCEWSKLSPTGEYLLLGPSVWDGEGIGIADIYKDLGSGSFYHRGPNFRRLSSITSSSWTPSLGSFRDSVFHPLLPMLVYHGNQGTFICDVSTQGEPGTFWICYQSLKRYW